jgi:hypothetical protein
MKEEKEREDMQMQRRLPDHASPHVPSPAPTPIALLLSTDPPISQ